MSKDLIEKIGEEYLTKNNTLWLKTLADLHRNKDNQNFRKENEEVLSFLFFGMLDKQALHSTEVEEYTHWFNQSLEVLLAFAQDNPDFYSLASSLISESRFGLNDKQKAHELLDLAIEKGSLKGVNTLAQKIYMGVDMGVDRDKAFDLVAQNISMGYDDSLLTKGIFHFYSREHEMAEEYLLKFIEKDDIIKLNLAYAYLGLNYLDLNQVEKGIEMLERGVSYPFLVHAQFNLGRLFLYGSHQIAAQPEKGVQLLQEAYEMGEPASGLFLSYYLLHNAPQPDLSKGHQILKQSATYPNHSCKFELARLYLYHQEFNQNKGEGIQLLTELTEENFGQGMVELAYQYLIDDLLPVDREKAKELCDRAFETGYVFAAYYLGSEYEKGNMSPDGEPDYKTAQEYYKKGAEQGEQNAMEVLAKYYRVGVVDEPEYQKAFDLNQKAIEQFNSPHAKIELALMYENNMGDEPDFLKAFELYQSASESNYPYAWYRMGVYYQRGLNSETGEPDLEKAFECFQKSKEFGYPDGSLQVNLAYLYGEGVPQDIEKGLQGLHEDYNNGLAFAAFEIGLFYENSENEEDNQLAHDYMKQAAEHEISDAFHKLGLYYYHGFGGVEVSLEQAFDHFTKAAELGYIQSYLKMGDMIYFGEMDKSYEEMFQYYQTAAEYGYVNHGLGLCYKFGLGVDMDDYKSLDALKKGAAQDNFFAKYHLALNYFYGYGTSENKTLAREIMQESAEEGFVGAQYWYGKMLVEGLGGEINEEEGIHYLTLAAENENDSALFELGNLYLIGKGVEADETKGIEMIKAAAELGNEDAQKIVKRL